MIRVISFEAEWKCTPVTSFNPFVSLDNTALRSSNIKYLLAYSAKRAQAIIRLVKDWQVLTGKFEVLSYGNKVFACVASTPFVAYS